MRKAYNLEYIDYYNELINKLKDKAGNSDLSKDKLKQILIATYYIGVLLYGFESSRLVILALNDNISLKKKLTEEELCAVFKTVERAYLTQERRFLSDVVDFRLLCELKKSDTAIGIKESDKLESCRNDNKVITDMKTRAELLSIMDDILRNLRQTNDVKEREELVSRLYYFKDRYSEYTLKKISERYHISIYLIKKKYLEYLNKQ